MKKSFSILALLALVQYVRAQDTAYSEPIKLTTEVGLQTNALFSRLTGSEAGLQQNPYLLTGKLVYGRLALRTGIGGSYKKTVQKEEGFADSKTNTSQSLDLRLGIERRFELGRRWMGMVGADAVGAWSQTKEVEDSGFDVITISEDVQTFGGGLVSGIQFNVSERLSFYTEGFVYYTTGEVVSGRFFKNFPIFDDNKERSETSELLIGLPSSLYLVFSF